MTIDKINAQLQAINFRFEALKNERQRIIQHLQTIDAEMLRTEGELRGLNNIAKELYETPPPEGVPEPRPKN